MRAFVVAVTLPLLAASGIAHAGSCDSQLRKASSADGAALVAAYEALAKCDATVAHDAFAKLMTRATDLDTLVPFTLAAIDTDGFVPVWEMMEVVPYDVRDELAEGVGAACDAHPKVVTFLQGAHAALKGTTFTAWSPAYGTCRVEAVTTWLDERLVEPPASPYSEKYDALLAAVVAARGKDALPILEKAAVAAAKVSGPFTPALEAMRAAVRPESLRTGVSPEDQAALEDALVRVAKAVPPEAAGLVADNLYTSGAEAKAASLLPARFPDRVQSDGTMRWAAAAVEQCDGDAVVHWTTWTEAPTRLTVADAAAGPLRASKGKLKCDAGTWAVEATSEPVADEDAAEAWADAVVARLEGEGLKVKTRHEKGVVSP